MSFISLIPCTTLALALATASPMPQDNGRQSNQRKGESSRFLSMDRNRDGVITRDEWRGSDQSFREHDWNGDGVLSGDELRPGARRSATSASNDPGNRQSAAYRAGYDRGTLEGRQAGREDKTHNRWDLDGQRELEQADSGYSSQLGLRSEYQAGYRAGFRQAYADGFGRPSASNDTRSHAYRAGLERGLIEGREAGRQDKMRRNRWDLEGQRELEQADSGYTPAMGPRVDYQAGYREGFRRAYAEGFGPR
jgi:hypothetical protein